MKKIMCMLTALLMTLTLLCGPAAGAEEEEYTLPREEGTRQLTFYWQDEEADYSTCDMWIW